MFCYTFEYIYQRVTAYQSYLLGLLAKIKCSICSYQLNLWYVGHRPTSRLNLFLYRVVDHLIYQAHDTCDLGLTHPTEPSQVAPSTTHTSKEQKQKHEHTLCVLCVWFGRSHNKYCDRIHYISSALPSIGWGCTVNIRRLILIFGSLNQRTFLIRFWIRWIPSISVTITAKWTSLTRADVGESPTNPHQQK